MPIGGTIGVGMGRTEGGTIGQIVGGQIGGRSMLLSQIGCMCPLTHSQTQFAFAEIGKIKAMAKNNIGQHVCPNALVIFRDNNIHPPGVP